jgi:hypothetical protein
MRGTTAVKADKIAAYCDSLECCRETPERIEEPDKLGKAVSDDGVGVPVVRRSTSARMKRGGQAKAYDTRYTRTSAHQTPKMEQGTMQAGMIQ